MIFATAGDVTGGSSSISAYNAFATSQAATLAAQLPGGVTWNAIVSTGTAAANEAVNNAPSSANIPIFSPFGTEISAGNLYSGSLLAPINFTQLDGTPNTPEIWTGSNTDGTALNPLGGIAQPEFGLFAQTGSGWIADANSFGPGVPWPIYVLSSPITSVPEPGTIALLVSAALGLPGLMLLRRKRRKALA